MKKIFGLGILTLLAIFITACGAGSKEKDQGNELKGTVVITGSTSVEGILLDMIDEFQAINPDVKINYTGTGSSAGIQDAIDGINSMGTSSRKLKDAEIEKGLSFDAFAYEGIAAVVHPSNPIKDISVENLAKIYCGQITNWRELGGEDRDIVMVSREGASGTRGAFEDLINLEDAGGLTTDATVVEGNGNVQTTVSGNKNAIGYVSFAFINNKVKALTIEEVEATPENTKEGRYQLSRPFLLVYQEDKLTPESEAFLDFTKTENAQSYVDDHGGIQIN